GARLALRAEMGWLPLPRLSRRWRRRDQGQVRQIASAVFPRGAGQFARAEAARLRARRRADNRAARRPFLRCPAGSPASGRKPHSAPVAGDAGDVCGLRLLARGARQTTAARAVSRTPRRARGIFSARQWQGSRTGADALHALARGRAALAGSTRSIL